MVQVDSQIQKESKLPICTDHMATDEQGGTVLKFHKWKMITSLFICAAHRSTEWSVHCRFHNFRVGVWSKDLGWDIPWTAIPDLSGDLGPDPCHSQTWYLHKYVYEGDFTSGSDWWSPWSVRWVKTTMRALRNVNETTMPLALCRALSCIHMFEVQHSVSVTLWSGGGGGVTQVSFHLSSRQWKIFKI